MGKNIEVSLEAFGNKRLTATFKPEELKGKNVGDIVSLIMSRNWNGEARQAHAIISREIQASGGYLPHINRADVSMPVKYQPVRLGEPITRYIKETGLPEDQVRMTVTGKHVVGYKL